MTQSGHGGMCRVFLLEAYFYLVMKETFELSSKFEARA
jgi:hypothetical protein